MELNLSRHAVSSSIRPLPPPRQLEPARSRPCAGRIKKAGLATYGQPGKNAMNSLPTLRGQIGSLREEDWSRLVTGVIPGAKQSRGASLLT